MLLFVFYKIVIWPGLMFSMLICVSVDEKKGSTVRTPLAEEEYNGCEQ